MLITVERGTTNEQRQHAVSAAVCCIHHQPGSAICAVRQALCHDDALVHDAAQLAGPQAQLPCLLSQLVLAAPAQCHSHHHMQFVHSHTKKMLSDILAAYHNNSYLAPDVHDMPVLAALHKDGGTQQDGWAGSQAARAHHVCNTTRVISDRLVAHHIHIRKSSKHR